MKISRVLAALALTASTWVQAGDLVLNLGGSSTYRIPLSSSTNVQISPITGDITARPLNTTGAAGDGWCPAGTCETCPAFQTSLGATQTSINVGASTILTWGTVNTTSCSTSASTYPAGVTGVTGWNASMPTSSAGTTLTLNTAGTYVFSLTCNNDTGPAVTRSVTVTVGGIVISFPSLTANPSSGVSPGGTSSLSWTATNATSCSTSGTTYPAGVSSVTGWNASMPTSSAGTVVTLPSTGTYTFSLTCSAAGATSVTRTATVQVADTLCVGHTPPSGMTRLTSFPNTSSVRGFVNADFPVNATLSLTRWNPNPTDQTAADQEGIVRSVFGRFGHTVGDSFQVAIPSHQYIAAEIQTGGIPSNRAGAITTQQPGQAAAPLFITISPCPGDPDPVGANCKTPYASEGMGIGWTFGTTPSSYCKLTSGTTYYLNVFFRDPDNLQSSDCGPGTCHWLGASSCSSGCATN